MRSPVLAMLWENWRLTRVEAAQRLSLGLVGGSAALALSDSGATIAVWVLLSLHGIFWMSIAKLTGGRFIDGYRPGFPLHLLYTRPVRTSVIVGVAMAYDAVSGAAMYVASAALLGFAFGQTLPLLSMAVLIAVFHMVWTFVQWSTRSKVLQWLGSCGIWGRGLRSVHDSWGRIATAARLLVRRQRTDGLDWPRVVRAHGRRRGAAASRRRTGGHTPDSGMAGFADWLAGLFRFPCPTSSATRAQVWFDLKSSGLPVLAIGVALAIVIPLLFVVTTQLDVVLSGVFTEPATRSVAVVVAMFSLPAVLILGGNAFGIRARQGRTYASAFEATQACGTARMAGLKVLVRSVCLLAALLAVGTSVWTSASVIPFDVLEDNDTFIEKSRNACERLDARDRRRRRSDERVRAARAGIRHGHRGGGHGRRTRGVHGTPRTLSPATEHRGIAAAAPWFVLVLLALAEQYGIASTLVFYAAQDLTNRVIAVVAAASVLATVYLFWSVLAERLLTLRQACGVLLVSAAFAAAWVTVLSAAGVQLTTMPATDIAV